MGIHAPLIEAYGAMDTLADWNAAEKTLPEIKVPIFCKSEGKLYSVAMTTETVKDALAKSPCAGSVARENPRADIETTRANPRADIET